MARHAAEAGLPPDTYRTSWTDLDDISGILIQSIIEAEDSRFYRHEGVYWRGTRKATQRYLAGQATGGASTITQQLARNLFLDSTRSPHRKIREILLAMRLERALSKARILELYVNVIEWGDGIWGIGPAAGHYFDTKPRELDVLGSVFLASIVPAPRRTLSGDNLDRALRVQERVIHQLRESGKIRDSEWNDVTTRLFGLQVALVTGHELPDARDRTLPIALGPDRPSGASPQPGC
jgi:monofunctional biosynthetic peptidoglycan transglycosylase